MSQGLHYLEGEGAKRCKRTWKEGTGNFHTVSLDFMTETAAGSSSGSSLMKTPYTEPDCFFNVTPSQLDDLESFKRL